MNHDELFYYLSSEINFLSTVPRVPAIQTLSACSTIYVVKDKGRRVQSINSDNRRDAGRESAQFKNRGGACLIATVIALMSLTSPSAEEYHYFLRAPSVYKIES